MRGGERRAGLGGAGSGGRPMHGAAPHAAGPGRARPSPYLPEAQRLALLLRVLLRLSADPSVLPLGGAPAAHRRPRPPGPLHRGQQLPGAERHRRSRSSALLRPPPPASPRRRSAAAGAGPSPDRAAAAGESARPRPAPPRTAPRPPAAPTGGAARGGEPRRGGRGRRRREPGPGRGSPGQGRGRRGWGGAPRASRPPHRSAPPLATPQRAAGWAHRGRAHPAGHTGHSTPVAAGSPHSRPELSQAGQGLHLPPTHPGRASKRPPAAGSCPMGPGARGSLAPRGEEGAAGTQKEPIAAGGRVWGAGAGDGGEGNTCPRCFPRKCRLRWPWLMLYPSVAARFIYLLNHCLEITANCPFRKQGWHAAPLGTFPLTRALTPQPVTSHMLC